ncbi:MAG TPA: hypothetical protein VEU77_07095 [Candidatus Acidoferrales bacterium]|nr:hypothetical protein [Candidatus Acidoferrales bacterium]
MATLPRPLEQRGLELVGHSDLEGRGDGMQIMRSGDVLYVGHMGDFGVGTSVVDIADATRPRVVRQLGVPRGTHSHKVQLAKGLLLANHEQYPYRVGVPESTGLLVYDVTRDARDPRRIGFLPIDGLGVHRIWWDGGRYAYASARETGFDARILIIVDLADPERPRLASRWWWPGQRAGYAERLPDGHDVGAHHVITSGQRAYGGYFDKGVVVYAVRDDGSLDLLSSLAWPEGGHPHTHTALPLGDRKLLVVTDEAIEPNCEGAPKNVHLVDVSDERRPREVSRFPVPQGDYCRRGLRFGPHNVHENRPGTFQSDRIVFVTYFNAGLRVYDTVDPERIVEIASYVPEAPAGQAAIQFNDVLVSDDGLIFVTDRVRGGLYVLRGTMGTWPASAT